METDHIQSCKPHSFLWFNHHHSATVREWQGHVVIYPKSPPNRSQPGTEVYFVTHTQGIAIAFDSPKHLIIKFFFQSDNPSLFISGTLQLKS